MAKLAKAKPVRKQVATPLLPMLAAKGHPEIYDDFIPLLQAFDDDGERLLKYASRRRRIKFDHEITSGIKELDPRTLSFKKALADRFKMPQLMICTALSQSPHGIPPNLEVPVRVDDDFFKLREQLADYMFPLDATKLMPFAQGLAVDTTTSVGMPFMRPDPILLRDMHEQIQSLIATRSFAELMRLYPPAFSVLQRNQCQIKQGKTVYTLRGSQIVDQSAHGVKGLQDYLSPRARLAYIPSPLVKYLQFIWEVYRRRAHKELMPHVLHHDMQAMHTIDHKYEKHPYMVATDYAAYDQSLPYDWVLYIYDRMAMVFGDWISEYMRSVDVYFPDYDDVTSFAPHLYSHRRQFPKADFAHLSGHPGVDMTGKFYGVLVSAWLLVKSGIYTIHSVLDELINNRDNDRFALSNLSDDTVAYFKHERDARAYKAAMSKFKQFVITEEDPPKFLGHNFSDGRWIPQMSSFLEHTFVPERGPRHLNRKAGWAAKQQYYGIHPKFKDEFLAPSLELFRKHLGVDFESTLVDDSPLAEDLMNIANLNWDEVQFLFDRETIHYKANLDNVRDEIKRLFFMFYSADDHSRILKEMINGR